MDEPCTERVHYLLMSWTSLELWHSEYAIYTIQHGLTILYQLQLHMLLTLPVFQKYRGRRTSITEVENYYSSVGQFKSVTGLSVKRIPLQIRIS
jgi:hypothetical protein